MPIVNDKKLKEYRDSGDWVECKISVIAEEVMRTLDLPEYSEFKIRGDNDIINKAVDDLGGSSITGYMADCISEIVISCHSRGEEYRRKWNREIQLKGEGDESNESGGMISSSFHIVDIPDSIDAPVIVVDSVKRGSRSRAIFSK